MHFERTVFLVSMNCFQVELEEKAEAELEKDYKIHECRMKRASVTKEELLAEKHDTLAHSRELNDNLVRFLILQGTFK